MGREGGCWPRRGPARGGEPLLSAPMRVKMLFLLKIDVFQDRNEFTSVNEAGRGPRGADKKEGPPVAPGVIPRGEGRLGRRGHHEKR